MREHAIVNIHEGVSIESWQEDLVGEESRVGDQGRGHDATNEGESPYMYVERTLAKDEVGGQIAAEMEDGSERYESKTWEGDAYRMGPDSIETPEIADSSQAEAESSQDQEDERSESDSTNNDVLSAMVDSEEVETQNEQSECEETLHAEQLEMQVAQTDKIRIESVSSESVSYQTQSSDEVVVESSDSEYVSALEEAVASPRKLKYYPGSNGSSPRTTPEARDSPLVSNSTSSEDQTQMIQPSQDQTGVMPPGGEYPYSEDIGPPEDDNMVGKSVGPTSIGSASFAEAPTPMMMPYFPLMAIDPMMQQMMYNMMPPHAASMVTMGCMTHHYPPPPYTYPSISPGPPSHEEMTGHSYKNGGHAGGEVGHCSQQITYNRQGVDARDHATRVAETRNESNELGYYKVTTEDNGQKNYQKNNSCAHDQYKSTTTVVKTYLSIWDLPTSGSEDSCYQMKQKKTGRYMKPSSDEFVQPPGGRNAESSYWSCDEDWKCLASESWSDREEEDERRAYPDQEKRLGEIQDKTSSFSIDQIQNSKLTSGDRSSVSSGGGKIPDTECGYEAEREDGESGNETVLRRSRAWHRLPPQGQFAKARGRGRGRAAWILPKPGKANDDSEQDDVWSKKQLSTKLSGNPEDKRKPYLQIENDNIVHYKVSETPSRKSLASSARSGTNTKWIPRNYRLHKLSDDCNMHFDFKEGHIVTTDTESWDSHEFKVEVPIASQARLDDGVTGTASKHGVIGKEVVNKEDREKDKDNYSEVNKYSIQELGSDRSGKRNVNEKSKDSQRETEKNRKGIREEGRDRFGMRNVSKINMHSQQDTENRKDVLQEERDRSGIISMGERKVDSQQDAENRNEGVLEDGIDRSAMISIEHIKHRGQGDTKRDTGIQNEEKREQNAPNEEICLIENSSQNEVGQVEHKEEKQSHMTVRNKMWRRSSVTKEADRGDSRESQDKEAVQLDKKEDGGRHGRFRTDTRQKMRFGKRMSMDWAQKGSGQTGGSSENQKRKSRMDETGRDSIKMKPNESSSRDKFSHKNKVKFERRLSGKTTGKKWGNNEEATGGVIEIKKKVESRSWNASCDERWKEDDRRRRKTPGDEHEESHTGRRSRLQKKCKWGSECRMYAKGCCSLKHDPDDDMEEKRVEPDKQEQYICSNTCKKYVRDVRTITHDEAYNKYVKPMKCTYGSDCNYKFCSLEHPVVEENVVQPEISDRVTKPLYTWDLNKSTELVENVDQDDSMRCLNEPTNTNVNLNKLSKSKDTDHSDDVGKLKENNSRSVHSRKSARMSEQRDYQKEADWTESGSYQDNLQRPSYQCSSQRVSDQYYSQGRSDTDYTQDRLYQDNCQRSNEDHSQNSYQTRDTTRSQHKRESRYERPDMRNSDRSVYKHSERPNITSAGVSRNSAGKDYKSSDRRDSRSSEGSGGLIASAAWIAIYERNQADKQDTNKYPDDKDETDRDKGMQIDPYAGRMRAFPEVRQYILPLNF